MSREQTPRTPTVGQQLDQELAARPAKSELTAVEMRLRTELRETEHRLRGEIGESEQRLRGEMKEFETRLDRKIDRVEDDLKSYMKALIDGHTQKLAEEVARLIGKPVPTKPRRQPAP